MKTLTIALLVFSLVHVGASRAEGLIEAAEAQGFSEKPIPVGDAWSVANRTLVSYWVTYEGRELRIGEDDQLGVAERIQLTSLPQLRDFLEQEDRGISAIHSAGPFIYVGTNRGEWGGELAVVDAAGGYEIILGENVVDIREVDGRVFVFTGLAHLSLNYGTVYEILDPDTAPTLSQFGLLPGAPQAVYVEDQAMYIATHHSLVQIQLIDSLPPTFNVIAANTFWRSLYPTSLIKDGNEILIGMRSGLALIELSRNFPFIINPEITYLTR